MKSRIECIHLKGSDHAHPKDHKAMELAPGGELMTVSLILRRRKGSAKLRELKDFPARSEALRDPISREQFAADHGADLRELDRVAAFGRSNGLDVLERSQARRSVVLRGTIANVNSAFGVTLRHYQSPSGRYRGHAGKAKLPKSIAGSVEAIIGLDNRRAKAVPHSTIRRQNPKDPSNTKPLTPQQAASLYSFPPGDGEGQTIGIYEMATGDPSDPQGPPVNAGYLAQDVKNTMAGFGGGLKVPTIVDVAVDGVSNSGVNDGETLLDITVAGAIAQNAKIAVYFTGGETQSILHALQRMIHPGAGDPVPTIISISYGWGPDDAQAGFTAAEFTQLGSLFQDAANLDITVLVSSGDHGAFLESKKSAQASYPATEPMVIACGGTTAGNVNGANFDEYVWNDVGAGGPGASGGGVSALFPVPSYQSGAGVPVHNVTKKAGRGVPDIAGNASENSGYMQNAAGSSPQPVGGTSAVAPLYAGLFARINANLGTSVGFINPVLYDLAGTAFRDIVGPPGPLNNSFGPVTGYPVGAGWDACTGLGSVKGDMLQNGLQAARAGSKQPAQVGSPQSSASSRGAAAGGGTQGQAPKKVFKTGIFKGIDVSNAFAMSANQQEAVVVNIGPIPWPSGLAPVQAPLAGYAPGTKITGPVSIKADALIILYTVPETQALLDVFTQDNTWSDTRRAQWCGYAHNFAQFAPTIEGIKDDPALEQGDFRLSFVCQDWCQDGHPLQVRAAPEAKRHSTSVYSGHSAARHGNRTLPGHKHGNGRRGGSQFELRRRGRDQSGPIPLPK